MSSLETFLLIYLFGVTKEHEASSTTQFSNISSTSINPSNNSYNPSSNNSSIPTSLEAASPNNSQTIGTIMKQGIQSYMEAKNLRLKQANDSYFAVLKYNTLFMYDNENQLDCKGVIIVSNHDVSMYPENLPDNEIFLKPTSIRLKKKQSIYAEMEKINENNNNENNNDNDCTTEPLVGDGDTNNSGNSSNSSSRSAMATCYYIFCDRCVDKEDWFFALQKSSKLHSNSPGPQPQIVKDKAEFDQHAMTNLLKTINSNDDHIKTQWLNATLGRIFLSIYKTNTIKEYFIHKLKKKIKRVKKPNFLSDIQIKSVEVGDGIPYITNPKLNGLSDNGDLSVDLNLDYNGGFRVEIETEAMISVTRLRTIKLSFVLAVVLKGLQGRLLLKIKPPPTNRIWFGFYEMPKLNLLIEPIVSETQLKFSPIIKAIESKIHEMIMDTVVLPNMDDLPFFPSFGMGGVYEESSASNNDKSDHDVLASNNNNDTNETKIMPATVNEHIKHEIINSNTSMDNNSPAEGSNDSCSGESNLTKSNNYGLGYTPPSSPSFSSTSPVSSPSSPSSPLSKSPSRNDCKIIQDHTDLFPGIKPILNTSIEELNQII
ncbi:8342_t:CDS:2 [Entrophospora sp. SA101]|nr:8342_t:CDS:2 [Entrophospora sp. SA101]